MRQTAEQKRVAFSNRPDAKTAGRNRIRPLRSPRAWVWIVSFVTTFVFYPVMTLFSMTMVRGQLRAEHVTDRVESARRFQNAVSSLLGFSQPQAVLAAVLGLLVGLEIFSWIHDRRRVDFYGSQPVTRNRRFARSVCTGVLTWVLPHVLFVAFSLMIAAAFGTGSRAVFLETVLAAVRVTLLFLSVFAAAVLASMLSGRLTIALLLTGFFLLAENVVRFVLMAYGNMFFKTWNATAHGNSFYLTSPLTTYTSPMMASLTSSDTLSVSWTAGQLALSSLHLLIYVLVVLLLAWLAWKNRPLEMAGSALRFGWLQTAVKAVTVVTAALGCGWFLNLLYSGTRPRLMAAAIVVSCAAGCVFAEMIFARDGRAAFRRLWHIPVLAGIALLVYGAILFDWTGFDTRVPKAARVESVCIYPAYDDAGIYYYTDEEDPESLCYPYNSEDYFLSRMQLSDPSEIGAACRLAKTCGSAMRERLDGNVLITEYDEAKEGFGPFINVVWTMKSGRIVARTYRILYDADTSDLDTILTSPDYREARYQFFPERVIAQAKGVSVQFVTPQAKKDAEGTDTAFVRAFQEAYLADLEGLDAGLMQTQPILLHVRIRLTLPGPDAVFYHAYPVYEGFSNTISLLSSYGGNPGELVFSGTPEEVIVYVPAGGAAENPDAEDSDYAMASAAEEALFYQDPKEMEAILSASEPVLEYSSLAPGNVRSGEDGRLDVFVDTGYDGYDEVWDEYGGIGFSMRIDPKRLPAFLEEDIRQMPNQTVFR